MRKILIPIILFILIFSTNSLAYIPDIHEKLSDIVMLTNYIESINMYLDSKTSSKIARTIISLSNKHGVPWEVISAIVENESTFYPNKIGPCKEIGLGQIYSLECNGEKFNKERLFDIKYNIECTIKIFKEKVKFAKGDILGGIMLYNGKGEQAERYLLKVCFTLICMLDYRIRYFNYKEAKKDGKN